MVNYVYTSCTPNKAHSAGGLSVKTEVVHPDGHSLTGKLRVCIY